jgi:uncharacterized membrane protein SirB2
MSQPTPQEAAAALRAVQLAGRRAQVWRSYRFDGPHLVLWSGINAVGYGLHVLMPQWQGRHRLFVDLAGIALGAMLIQRQYGDRSLTRRYVAALALLVLFFVAILAVALPPPDVSHIPLFVGSFFALAYALGGVLFGGRYLAIGAALAGSTWLALAWPPGPSREAWQGAANPLTLLLLGCWQCRGR